MQRSEQIGDLITALAKAQAEFTFAAKDSTNPAFNSKYADLAANISAVRPALSKHGIALMQFDASDVERQTASVTTTLHHGEQWIGITAEAPAVGQKGFNVQSLGACWTYLRRYTLQAICGLASDDDDGNSLAVENSPVVRKTKAETKAEAQQRADTLKNPPTDSGPFELSGDFLKCVVKGVVQKTTSGEKARPYSLVTWNGSLQGMNFASCFDTAQEDALQVAVGKVCHLKIKPPKEGDKFLNILSVAAIDGKIYENGQPTGEVFP